MGLGLRWAFIVLLVAYGLSAVASVDDFNQIIHESTEAEQQLAFEIQTHLGISKEKIAAELESSPQHEILKQVALENSDLK